MAEQLFYATHNVSGFKEGHIAFFDPSDPEDAGMINSGYFAEIEEPDRGDAVQGEDRP